MTHAQPPLALALHLIFDIEFHRFQDQRSNLNGFLTSLVPRLSLSFSHFFACANFIREKRVEGEGEPGMEPCPPVATWLQIGDLCERQPWH